MAKELPKRDVYNLTIKEAKWVCLALGLTMVFGIIWTGYLCGRLTELEERRAELHEQVAVASGGELVTELEEVITQQTKMTRWRWLAICGTVSAGLMFLGVTAETVKFLTDPRKKKWAGRRK